MRIFFRQWDILACGRTKMADTAIQRNPKWWRSLVASSFCHRSRQISNLQWVVLYSSETKEAAQTMLTSSTLYRKWRSKKIWIRTGYLVGQHDGQQYLAWPACGKKTADCLNLPLGFFSGGILLLVVEATCTTACSPSHHECSWSCRSV